jgi:hypothetical protein
MIAKFTNIDKLMDGLEQEIKEKKEQLKWYKLKVKQISERAA